MNFQTIPIQLLQKILSLTDIDITFRTLIEEISDNLAKVSNYKIDIYESSEDISSFLTRLAPDARKAIAQSQLILGQDQFSAFLPLLSTKKNTLGVAVLEFREKFECSQEKKIYLETIASLISMTIERKQSVKETKRILRELQASQERLGLALQSQKMGVWDWDIINDHLYWDETMYEVFGVSENRSEKTFKLWQDRLAPDNYETAMATVYSVLENHVDFDHTFKIIKNGEQRTIAAVGSVIRDEFGKAIRFTGLNWDITEKVLATKKLEEQRAKAISNSKMASLGEMASGIAHEINNPLTIILNRTNQLKLFLQQSDPDRKHISSEIEKIESTFQRIVKIIRGLKAFSRNADNDPMISCDINSIIDDTLELCLEKFKTHGIDLKLSGLDYFYYLACRPSQLSQVLLNLLNNSFDAIKGTNNPWIEMTVSIENVARESFIQIQVKDSGQGIPQGIAEKMMEPFFTTKDVGQGTGLGLAISKGIIEQHKGQFWLDKDAANTCFILRLPLEEIAPRTSPSPVNSFSNFFN